MHNPAESSPGWRWPRVEHGHRHAVMECGIEPGRKLVDALVSAGGLGCRQPRRHASCRHWFAQDLHKDHNVPLFSKVTPGRGERHAHSPGGLALRPGCGLPLGKQQQV